MADMDLTKLTDAQLGALKMVGGDLTKLPDAALLDIKATLSAPTPEPGIVDKAVNAAGKVAGVYKTGLDYASTAGTRVASGLLGAPEDINRLARAGTKYALESAFGPTPATIQRQQQEQMVEPWSPVGLPEENRGVMPGSPEIKKAILGASKMVGLNERNLRDIPAATLAPPFLNGGKINLGAVGDAAIDSGIGMLAGPGGLANAGRNIAIGVGGAIPSELAGQATHGTKWEFPARIGGALLGGGATMLGQNFAEKSASMLAPWTQGGKERIAQDIVGGAATDPKKAASILEGYTGDAVPGVTQTAPKITADPGLLSLENYVSGTMGANQRLQSLADANNTARATHLGSLEAGDIGNFVTRLKGVDAGLAADVDKALAVLPPSATPTQAGQAIQDALAARQASLSADRRTVTQPLYDEVASWKGPVDARQARLEAKRQIGTSKGELQTTAKGAAKTLYTPEGLPDNSPLGVLAARQDMANTLSKEATTPAEARILQAIQKQTDIALEDAIPAARTARTEYQRMTVPLEPFSKEKGPGVFRAINESRPVDPSVIPQSFLQPGQRGVAGIRSLQATGAPAALEPLPGYVSGMVRGAPQDAGKIATNLGPALDQLDPTLRPQISAVQGATDARTGFQATPAGRMAIGNDASKELGTVLAAKDGKTQIGNMVVQAGGDEAALRGLRKGILDDFKATIESKGGTDAAGEATLLSSKAKTWVEDKMQNARAALTPDQEKGIRALVDSLDVQSRVAPKMAGSDTVRNAMSGTFMGKILSGGASNIPGVSALLKTANTQADVIRIVAETLADPQAAKVMLMKYSDANAKLTAPIWRSLAERQPVLLPQEVGGQK